MEKTWAKFDLLRLFDTARPIDQGSNEVCCEDLVKIGAYTKVYEYVYVKESQVGTGGFLYLRRVTSSMIVLFTIPVIDAAECEHQSQFKSYRGYIDLGDSKLVTTKALTH